MGVIAVNLGSVTTNGLSMLVYVCILENYKFLLLILAWCLPYKYGVIHYKLGVHED